MVPFWFLPFAIACGNTFVLKPSEQVPLTQELVFNLIHEHGGLPDGVVNLVNGSVDVVNGLLDHPGVDAVSFVGSAKVAQYVYERAAATGKRVQALGRRQELHGRDARRGDRQDGRKHPRLGVRRRRPALHGGVGRDRRGRRRPPLMEELERRTRELNVGDGLETCSDVGPVVCEASCGRILAGSRRA